jgi:hypothetical protein
MKIQQFIKMLNNTELGKGNTHECYVLVSKKVPKMDYFFDTINTRPVFIDKITNTIIANSIHITKGSELRINGLSDYYSRNKACPGDEILFERRDDNGKTEFLIDLKSNQNIIVFQKNSKGFEALNIDRLSQKLANNKFEHQILFNDKVCNINIQFKESSKKRSDSPESTDFYQIIVDDKDILDNFRSNDFIELEEFENTYTLKKVVVWQKYEFKF